jgi:hypothetical protein
MATWRAVGMWSLGILVLTLAEGHAAGQVPDAPRFEAGSHGDSPEPILAQRLPRRPTPEEQPAEPAQPEAPAPVPAAPAAPTTPPGPPLRTPVDPPLGFTVPPSGIPAPEQTSSDFFPQPDRWRIGFPRWDRYGRPFDSPYAEGRWWDPYNLNILKGDYPIWGQNIFFAVTATSDTLVEARKLPTPRGVAAARAPTTPFFGRGEQYFVNQNFILQLELFEGVAAFRPRDFEIRLTPIVNLNYLKTQETAIVDVFAGEGTDRLDSFTTLLEASLEYHLVDLSPNYDFLSLKAGVQPFLSDFRGFVFADGELGGRLFGNYFSNRLQYNLAYFYMLEKDTNSGLASFDSRHQHVVIANTYYQDFLWPGYTLQLSFHYNRDNPSTQFDDNGFIVRPAPIGGICSGVVENCRTREHAIDAFYLGWTGDGHIGRLNLTHAFYQVLGRDSLNPIPARQIDINAQMFALEASVDIDWLRPKLSFFWASGDDDPNDDEGRGFDSIFDNPNFAGGAFSFWGRQGIALTQTRVSLKGRNSLIPTLRSSKEQGQANFVNPGLFLFNAGIDAFVSPKLRAFANLNYLRFQETEVLEQLLFQREVDPEIGWDLSIGLQYRPFLIDNVILSVGLAGFLPGKGFKDIYEKSTLLYSAFAQLTLTY